MADESDIADAYITATLNSALEEMRRNTVPAQGAEFCKECGDSMPLARQQLGFQFCVVCAEEKERREALFMR